MAAGCWRLVISVRYQPLAIRYRSHSELSSLHSVYVWYCSDGMLFFPHTMLFIFAAAFGVLFASTPANASGADARRAQMVSFLPDDAIEAFIFENLNLASYRNILGPSREAGMRYFRDFGFSEFTVKNDTIVITDNETVGIYIKILFRGDANGDGVEDLVVQIVDQAIGGRYLSETHLMLTRYSNDTDLIAINYEPAEIHLQSKQ